MICSSFVVSSIKIRFSWQLHIVNWRFPSAEWTNHHVLRYRFVFMSRYRFPQLRADTEWCNTMQFQLHVVSRGSVYKQYFKVSCYSGSGGRLLHFLSRSFFWRCPTTLHESETSHFLDQWTDAHPHTTVFMMESSWWLNRIWIKHLSSVSVLFQTSRRQRDTSLRRVRTRRKLTSCQTRSFSLSELADSVIRQCCSNSKKKRAVTQ